ncbi:L-serine ammonia-lyase [Aeromicrobium sp. P5_D10]
MALSVFDLYSIGIGPSSSHTVGPMRAARMFACALTDDEIDRTQRVVVELYGSLGATGRGHGSEKAVMLGLEGEDPATVDIAAGEARVDAIRTDGLIRIAGVRTIRFDPKEDLILHHLRSLPQHPNGMTIEARGAGDAQIVKRTYFSVGGGFVVEETVGDAPQLAEDDTHVPYPFSTSAELLGHCAAQRLSISDVMMRNELVWRTEDEVRAGLLEIWDVMQECVRAGVVHEGVLPGGLKVLRRAPALHQTLVRKEQAGVPPDTIDWLNLFALAVNEENAAGGRIVTAPTNGAAGIIPSVLHHYTRFVPGASDEGVVRFMLTAAAIGILIKTNASISGAEMGCQGEVGSACSMAAAGLCEVLGGTPAQVENAAEMGIEHNLGLTCDPIGGLVQIPCIERNAIASVKALNAAQLSLHGDGIHKVSLDQVIDTMRETGMDMSTKYKETSRGGLAVNVVEC